MKQLYLNKNFRGLVEDKMPQSRISHLINTVNLDHRDSPETLTQLSLNYSCNTRKTSTSSPMYE